MRALWKVTNLILIHKFKRIQNRRKQPKRVQKMKHLHTPNLNLSRNLFPKELHHLQPKLIKVPIQKKLSLVSSFLKSNSDLSKFIWIKLRTTKTGPKHRKIAVEGLRRKERNPKSTRKIIVGLIKKRHQNQRNSN